MHSYQHGAGHMLQFQTDYGICHSSGDVSNICYNNIMVFCGVMLCSLVDMYQSVKNLLPQLSTLMREAAGSTEHYRHQQDYIRSPPRRWLSIVAIIVKTSNIPRIMVDEDLKW